MKVSRNIGTCTRRSSLGLPNRFVIETTGCLTIFAIFVWTGGCNNMKPQEGNGGAVARLVLEDLDGAILSITGPSSSDVYAVGGDSNDGQGPMFLHYDGMQWERIPTGVLQGDLWWISVDPIDGQYFMSGADGLILSFDTTSGTVQSYKTPGDLIVFGIWGAASDDIWAVGGDVKNDGTGFIWHYDGKDWSAIGPESIVEGGFNTLYKIWGRSADEVFAVGQSGTALRYDGVNWVPFDPGTTRTLFTVHGDDDDVVGSGGFGNAAIVEDTDSGFVNVADESLPQMNGVYVTPNLQVAAGISGAIAYREPNGWVQQDTGLNLILDFHAAWIDPAGGVWAVGGDLNVGGLNQGIIAYVGTESISSDIAP